ncbi:spermatogenesis-associated protein 6 isoform X1 [Chiloscyllium plagiosum]|uniref:spermatogenesis-associated protein 6 isoform X1 n=1 Tax=Chiloscyllium plagiosum TaxID=36176 RepID=UPI001CB82F69|nr:spermatogenesis-associated protein 6 isoform X1 [Chiloscyllium plagiosum]
MPKKVLRLTVHLKIQAVTCPGVFLPEKNDVYVSVCMLGRFQKTKFVPSVFPLTFNEKVKIEKNFPEAMNPGDVADILEMDTTKFELIQLTPPVGETLAVYEQNTREFLYPGRKLTPSYPGMDRELLMKRSVDFPGIAPRLEFSTTSIIKECPYDLRQIESEEDNVTLELQSSPLRKSMTQLSKRKPSPCPREFSKDNSYKQPTIASQTRSLSPYTKRRMAALSEDANQRLAHLNLGPYQFKKETDSKPPFVIRHVDHKLLPPDDLYIASSSLTSKPSSQKNSPLGSWIYNDPSLRGSYGPSRTSLNMIKKPREKDLQDNSFEDTDELIMSEPAGRQLSPTTTSMNYLTTSSFQKQSPVLNRLSLREREPWRNELLKHEAHPRSLKAHPASYTIHPKVETELEWLVNLKALASVTTSEWAAPIIPVLKTEGVLRICGYFKVTVNPVLCADQYPLPCIEDLFTGRLRERNAQKLIYCRPTCRWCL